MPNLVNAEAIGIAYGTRTILDQVSLGLSAGDVVGVVGRNGDGKTTLLSILTGTRSPDAGRVTHNGSISIGLLSQAEVVHPGETVRDLIVGGRPDHVWASDPYARSVVAHLLAGINLDADTLTLSGGERRRAALVSLVLGRHDLLVLDEPTNHLDVEAVDWLASHLRELQQRGVAMMIVSHDRWFLDAVCNRIWEVHDAVVDSYDGGYAAYVLTRAERARMTAASEARRRNLLRKELAWLRRGAPARTSKPKFRIDAATTLIEDEPPPRDTLALRQFSASRLGKDVFDLNDVNLTLPDGRRLLDRLTWSIGPGERIGLIGVNGSGKSTLLRLLAGEQAPTRGRVQAGKTIRVGHLSQDVGELPDDERVLESVERLRRQTRLATGREASASNLLEDFGFTGERLVARIGDLSGGERRRLQLLRLLIEEPNVLLLDEPTNDLDIDTLTVIEDYLDRWPGTLIVVTHDRYFLERTCDVTYALMGDGRCVLLPGGVDAYLTARGATPTPTGSGTAGSASRPVADAASTNPAQRRRDAATERAAKKELARLESQLARCQETIDAIHGQMAASASDYTALAKLQEDLEAAELQREALEDAWLTAAESA